MRTLFYSSRAFDRQYYETAGRNNEFGFTDKPLSLETAALSAGYDAVCLFSGDDAAAPVLLQLHHHGVRFVALRSAGYDHVDLKKANRLGMRVARVPAYSPYAIAEHAVALMLALNRKLIKANDRVRSHNFSLNGLTGFDMNGKTAGIIGTGRIGSATARILHGFGCRILAFDVVENEDIKQRYQVEYTDLASLYASADIVTLHVPLNDRTRYMIDRFSIDRMKTGVMLINTARGGLVDTEEVIRALKSGHIGYFGTDVYEKERPLFFEDRSEQILQDDAIARLMTFPNVLITGHQAFLTHTALRNICDTTLHNLDCFAKGLSSGNELT